jgi:hypothetical protein
MTPLQPSQPKQTLVDPAQPPSSSRQWADLLRATKPLQSWLVRGCWICCCQDQKKLLLFNAARCRMQHMHTNRKAFYSNAKALCGLTASPQWPHQP